MVVEVLVTERDAEDALAEQRRHRVQQRVRIAAILEAVCEPRDQADRSVRGPEQQPAGMRGDLAAVERAHTRRPSTVQKSNESWLQSVCIGEVLRSQRSRWCTITIAESRP